MDEFVAKQNVSRFRQLLERETDPEERRRIAGLMSEAQAALRRFGKGSGQAPNR